MKFTEYQVATRRTAPTELSEKDRIANMVFGLNGEVGEVTELLKKFMYHGHHLDDAELEKELGDVMWYLARIIDEFHLDMEYVAEKNIIKLKRRYPEKFDTELSINRKE